MRTKYILLITFVLLFYSKTYAQAPFDIGFMQDYGFLLKHTVKIGHLQTRPLATTLYFNKYHLKGDKWLQKFNHPKTSFALTYFNFRSKVIGHTLALTSNMLFPIFTKLKNNFEVKIGTGVVYSTRPFDIQTNFTNNVLSNRWSYVMQLGGFWDYHLNEHWHIKPALQLTHYSNGAYKLPNAGVNVVTASIGAAYTFHPEKILYEKEEQEAFSKKWRLQAALAGSLIETEVNQPKKHKIINLGIYAGKDLSEIHFLHSGLDVSWSEGVKYQINKNFADSSSRPDYKRVSFVVGDEIRMGKMSVNIQLGVYIYKQYIAIADMPFYQRYGLKYYWFPNVWTGIFLKSHAATAESAEFTIGGSFVLKKKD